MKKGLPVLWLVLFLFFPQPVLPQDRPSENLLYLSVYLRLQRLKTEKEERLKRLESDITRVQEKLKETNALLAEIQRIKSIGTDREKNEALTAEPYALNALRSAKEALDSLSRQKSELQMALERLRAEETRLSGLHDRLRSGQVAGLLRSCEGHVRIANAKTGSEGRCSPLTPLGEGDTLITGPDGRAKAVILDGRGELVLGPNSELAFKKRTTTEETLDLLRGKMYVQVEAREKFLKSIKELLEKKKEEIEGKVRELRIWYCDYLRRTTGRECLVPQAILGVRGTRFSYDTTEEVPSLYVYEGTVEVFYPERKEAFEVSEGHMAKISPDGILVQRTAEADQWWTSGSLPF